VFPEVAQIKPPSVDIVLLALRAVADKVSKSPLVTKLVEAFAAGAKVQRHAMNSARPGNLRDSASFRRVNKAPEGRLYLQFFVITHCSSTGLHVQFD
jgi:hypothetical protein